MSKSKAPAPTPKRAPQKQQKSKSRRELDEELDQAPKDTFPASDPVALESRLTSGSAHGRSK